jgi:HEAT repeat protein
VVVICAATVPSAAGNYREAAVIALASLLSDNDTIVRHHSVNALGEIGGDMAILYLLAARYDSHLVIRTNTESILFELGYEADY